MEQKRCGIVFTLWWNKATRVDFDCLIFRLPFLIQSYAAFYVRFSEFGFSYDSVLNEYGFGSKEK